MSTGSSVISKASLATAPPKFKPWLEATLQKPWSSVDSVNQNHQSSMQISKSIYFIPDLISLKYLLVSRAACKRQSPHAARTKNVQKNIVTKVLLICWAFIQSRKLFRIQFYNLKISYDLLCLSMHWMHFMTDIP